jgi:hypothetical protein
MCVSECPTSTSTVLCKQPSFFTNNVKFVNCTYYPFAYRASNSTTSYLSDVGVSKNTYYGPALRYGTELGIFLIDNTLVLGKYCVPDSQAL